MGLRSGPISYLIVESPGNKMTGEGFPILVDLVDRGLIRILDLMFAYPNSACVTPGHTGRGAPALRRLRDEAQFCGAACAAPRCPYR